MPHPGRPSACPQRQRNGQAGPAVPRPPTLRYPCDSGCRPGRPLPASVCATGRRAARVWPVTGLCCGHN
ncbi:MAG: phage DNA packaging protein J [Oscillospiraceae bacterium]|nr:phage DNA packaging protein J [Oscillospiraceae bacterium]